MPEDNQPVGDQPTPDTNGGEQPTPPWGTSEEFDPEKAWNLIQGLRADKDRLSQREAITPDQKQRLSEYDALVEASQTDAQRKDAELARWQTEAEQWRKTSVSSRVEALAAGMDFAYPSDAAGQLDAERYVDSGGVIDEAAIKTDLADLLQRRPLWRKPTDPSTPAAPPSRLPAPNGAQGSGNGTPSADPAAEFAALIQGRLGGTQ